MSRTADGWRLCEKMPVTLVKSGSRTASVVLLGSDFSTLALKPIPALTFFLSSSRSLPPAIPQAEAVQNRDLAARGEEGTKEHWVAPADPAAHDPRGMKSWVTCAGPSAPLCSPL